ncbi:DUF4262 domain-containing protein [Dactylosporangium sp. NPDC051484]|uniref:DUF4262 domain-containing protein n=1 Tax=Dactylosporangium sp. NPDC051484 TaxID=3154942 RepID=UPI00344EB312
MNDHQACNCHICEAGIPPEGDPSQMIARVKKFGWSVQGVADYDEDEPDWAYTIGLWHSFRTPDLCMFGLDVEDMIAWLNDVAELVESGLRLQVNDVVPDVLDGFALHVRPVDESWHEGLFGQSLNFYDRPVPMLELIWPDKNGKLPWEQGARARCREWQPRLWTPVTQHTVGPWREIATVDDE